MILLGKWQIATNPSRDLGYDVTRTHWSEDPELQEIAAEFITRQILEKDPIFFEG